MFDNFIKYIEENQLVKPRDRVLMAVSGGIDSMVMAHLFIRMNIRLGIAHCNFCLRGTESDEDEEFVSEFARINNIPFYSNKFRTREYASKKGISIQMSARELRYEWFEKIRRKNGFDSIAVAHNLNDNAETFLINLTRGTGIAGLTGMKKSGNKVIRPILFASRESIREYCCENKIGYREDRSNAETKYTRNKIRHLVIPLLKQINPSIETTLNETAERLGEINDIVNDLTGKLREKLFHEENGEFFVKIRRISPILQKRTLLFELFRPYGINSATVRDLQKIIAGKTGSQIFTDRYKLLKNRDEIIISEKIEIKDNVQSVNTLAELRKFPGIRSARTFSPGPGLVECAEKNTALLDYRKVKFPVTIRKWQQGDSFYPFGMKKKKKLSDYFIDRKFSRLDKEKVLILESDGKIAWIMGERTDDRFRVTGSTRRILKIELE